MSAIERITVDDVKRFIKKEIEPLLIDCRVFDDGKMFRFTGYTSITKTSSINFSIEYMEITDSIALGVRLDKIKKDVQKEIAKHLTVSTTALLVNEREKLLNVAGLIDDEILLKNVSILIEKRKLMARDMLYCNDSDAFIQMKKVFDYYEEQLKKLLALS